MSETKYRDMAGRNVIVTGATGGIGLVTARKLAGMGAAVWLVGRDPHKTRHTAEHLRKTTGNPQVDNLVADLSSISAIRGLAAEIHNRMDRLDVLVNNAGAVFTRRHLSVDGLEMTFALNHVNYFLLTNLLMGLLQKPASARIVNVSSSAHFFGHIDFSNLQGLKPYISWSSYGNSKLMNILFSRQLAASLAGSQITVNALHPGFVATNFGKSNGGLMLPVFALTQILAISPEDGAKTSIYLAAAEELEGVTGKYFAKCKEAISSPESQDMAVAARLWDATQQVIDATGA